MNGQRIERRDLGTVNDQQQAWKVLIRCLTSVVQHVSVSKSVFTEQTMNSLSKDSGKYNPNNKLDLGKMWSQSSSNSSIPYT